jgi:hypothetical protein
MHPPEGTSARPASPHAAPETGRDDGPAVVVEPRSRRLDRRQRWGLVAISFGLLVSILVLGGVVLPSGSGADPAPGGLVYVIPAGRAATLSEPGVDSALAIPTDIRFASTETASITIRNDDSVTHRAGPFVIAAGQSFVQRFRESGTYPIVCTVDPADSIVVTVEQ